MISKEVGGRSLSDSTLGCVQRKTKPTSQNWPSKAPRTDSLLLPETVAVAAAAAVGGSTRRTLWCIAEQRSRARGKALTPSYTRDTF